MPIENDPRSKGFAPPWRLGVAPTVASEIPDTMLGLVLHRDSYGPPSEVLAVEEVPTPRLGPSDARQVLVSVLATGPNFNTNFAALGLPVPVFSRGDTSTKHIPGSDALGLVVDAGSAVASVKVGQAVIVDSWTGRSIRGYETHDGFNAQFISVDEDRVLAIPSALAQSSPERLAALLLTYGTAYRCIVERLRVRPNESVLVMGGGKGTSYAGAQIAKALGARVILVGSNRGLANDLIKRGVADAFVDRTAQPPSVYGVLAADENQEEWLQRSQPFRDSVLAANGGNPVNKVFEHTGGSNFPLLVSVLADHGALAFFGATGQGLKGEYKETFFYDGRRLTFDARWVWMRQKQILFRKSAVPDMFDEIQLPPGRKGLIWGADEYSQDFVKVAEKYEADIVVIASRSHEASGIEALAKIGVGADRIIDRDLFKLCDDMPDPLLSSGAPNPAYELEFATTARALGRSIWAIFGARVSPDFVVERPDQSTLHYSAFLARDFDEEEVMPTSYVLMRGASDLEIRGSHMYHRAQAHEVVRLLSHQKIVMEQEDLDIVALDRLPHMQQMMLDGTMIKPKGVALVQSERSGQAIAEYEANYFGAPLQSSNPPCAEYVDVHSISGVAIVTIDRPDTLNALDRHVIDQLRRVIVEIADTGGFGGTEVDSVILRGAGRAFVAGADVEQFVGRSASDLESLAAGNMAVFATLEALPVPVVAVADGFALGGGNELLMSTHYRIATENAKIGQPEVKLGIIPGYGAMQRLPRLVGPRIAAELSVNGEPIGAHTAARIGLVHEVCRSSTAMARAYAVAKALASGSMKVARPDWDALASSHHGALHDLVRDRAVQQLMGLEEPANGEEGDLGAARGYAARLAIEAMRTGFEVDFSAGLANDARLFGELVASPSGQHWVRRFIAKDPEQSTFLLQLEPTVS